MATVVTDPPAFLQTLPSPPLRLLYRMSMEKYEAMVESGVFTKRDRFQLLEGLLVAIMTENPPHAIACELCSEVLKRVLPTGWQVRSDRPLRIPARTSEPEPDLVVARGEIRDYRKRHPEPVDVSLVIEVADSSLEEDRTLMAHANTSGMGPESGSNLPASSDRSSTAVVLRVFRAGSWATRQGELRPYRTSPSAGGLKVTAAGK